MSTATDTATTPAAQPTVSSFAMFRTLVGISLISGLLLAGVFESTKEIIKKNKAEMLRKAVFAVVPGASNQTIFELQADGSLLKVEGEPTGLPKVIPAFDDGGAFLGVALEASGKGYGGDIKILYGYSPAKQIVTGIKVLESNETPGLGDKIKVPPFTDCFSALDVSLKDGALAKPIKLKKAGGTIDGITGATISSKAITDMIQESASKMLPIVQDNLAQLKGDS